MTAVTAGTAAASARRPANSARRAALRRRYLTNVGAAFVSVVLLIWTIVPLYNMVMVALEREGDVAVTHIFPPDPSVASFWVVITEGHWYLEAFWHQFGNSVYMAAMVTILTLLIFYLIMNRYGLQNNPWSVISVLVTFATPYAIFIFQEYGRSIPLELDESARIDGASPLQIYVRIYLPLMAPALVAVGTYALLLTWNEYLYQFLLLSNDRSMTVAVALGKFLNSDVAPWNYMMATAIIYALPPIATYYMFRGRMSSGLTMGGVKG